MPTILPSFYEAEREACKASVLIEGLSGNGKSGLAMEMAYYLADEKWDGVYSVDTENRSLRLYRGLRLSSGPAIGKFKTGDLTADDGFAPSNYAAFRDLAIQQHGKVLVCDSISHMWQYKGGILDKVTKAQQEDPRLNKYTVWGIREIVEEKNMIMDLMRSSRIHQINTVRSKEKMEIVDDETTGRKTVQSLGEQQIMMPDLKYEPDLVLAMVKPGTQTGEPPVAKVNKSRYAIFTVGEEYRFTKELFLQLRDYLATGADPEVLLEQQRQEYVEEITTILDTNKGVAKNIWPNLKEQAGHKTTKLDDIPLAALKTLYGQLVQG